MIIKADPHVHTIFSGHAYSTLGEYIDEAKIKNIDMFAITDHAPTMPGTVNEFYFHNQVVIPRKIDGIYVLRGTEANIIDFDGNIDISENLAGKLDLVIGSFHPICFRTGTKSENTKAYIKMMERGLAQIIGHPGNLNVEVDIEEIIKAAKYYNVLIEINNSTFLGFSRRGSEYNCEKFVEIGLKNDILFAVSSDAHIRYELGNFDESISRLEKYGVTEDNVANATAEKFRMFLNSKGKLLNE